MSRYYFLGYTTPEQDAALLRTIQQVEDDMTLPIDERPKPLRHPIQVAGDLVRRGDDLSVEAAKIIRDLHDLLKPLRELTARQGQRELEWNDD